jgi:hypothetical protein
MRKTREKKSHKLNILLTKKQHDNLIRLAETRSQSQGDVMRRLLDTAWLMATQHRPFCVSGADCLVPAAHYGARQKPEIGPEPTEKPAQQFEMTV